MENDIEYANAVYRLQSHKCYFDNVDLFNSRVITSPSNPNGVNMGSPENIDAVAIVSTNILRSGINTKKAEIISKNENSPQLIICAAYDTC